jgi:anti-sigma regulatory factor (Ser/Thr protein kinase)
LRDYAEPCKPEIFLNKEFKPNESGHMGLSIIRKLTDEFTIKPLQDGNETKLVFRID